MSTNTLLFGILFFLLAVIIFFIIRIEIRLHKIFKGSKAENLENLIADIVKGVTILDDRCVTQAKNIQSLSDRLDKQGHGIKLIRFNPFGEVGSNQSFAVGIMNKEGDGVVFSSLYSRERMSVFAKPIIAGKSDIELSKEESAVVADAHQTANQ